MSTEESRNLQSFQSSLAIIENLESFLGSRLANCGNILELQVLTQLHHVH